MTTVVTLILAMTGLAILAWLFWPWLPIDPDATGTAKLAMIALLVVIVVSFSPTMTAAVIAETGSRGKLSDFVLAMVVLADLIVLLLFSLTMQLAASDSRGRRAGRREHARQTRVGNRRSDRLWLSDRGTVRALSEIHRT